MKNSEISDITIIGAGPVGLFTAFYAGMREASVKIIDSMQEVGGQLAALYPDKYIYDVAGFPGVKARDLVAELHKQALTFSPTICLDEQVQNIIQLDDGTFEIHTSKNIHFTKSIIISAGAGAFEPRRLKLDEAVEFENRTLHYFVKDLNHFDGKQVLICGGGDSAVDWALALEDIASEVTLIHRRDAFRAHEHSLTLLKSSSVTIRTPFELKELIGTNGVIEQAVIQKVKSVDTEIYSIDEVIVNYGFITNIGPIKSWGLNTTKNAIIVNGKMETNIPGIYAAGDICAYEGKPKLIATGFGEATIAVNHAKSFLDPKAKLSVHSTHLFAEPK
ncbi:NAD(P)/FAD-dependent oxidoreductase [Ornithinibacillus halotolerans]|uniref:Ferredoxin--NADP reductase n=1 Tax=Ornithinibacillus halotolerans TaxID=1274357 RepID=A0A916S6J0_9BACI|nr:NAD(P)/FAD-dependent oxidoreductase [Ornithinibacillus halotolerans]GGA83065.1 ferredoxin--NADP reductase 2 [Ornithinibacillus halotolerans]